MTSSFLHLEQMQLRRLHILYSYVQPRVCGGDTIKSSTTWLV
ncbi:hypothetical protein AF72_10615 [Xylella taiwanensis]|uniref:Uncharacterized protein n=1 Tax=Xylella taiwanensis TaxID=1444770 RepID=Z9JHA1_9GAMM|nr:hypothetical protein AF72_10615 [Xylella taiwanensis]